MSGSLSGGDARAKMRGGPRRGPDGTGPKPEAGRIGVRPDADEVESAIGGSVIVLLSGLALSTTDHGRCCV